MSAPWPKASMRPPGDDLAESTASSRSMDRERRRYARFPLALQGRYMLEDGREFPCQTTDVSAVGVAVSGPPVGAIGDWVIAYVDEIGRIEGAIVRRTPVSFALEIRASLLKLQRLAIKINRLARAEDERLLDRRTFPGSAAIRDS
jgi:PilZ domain